MSEQSPDDDGPMSVPDDELPEDVRPGEDNPLAEPVGDDVPDDVVADVEPRSSEDTHAEGGDGEDREN
ncbi:MAG TPA: hypothetical protein VHW64_11225 [Nocardioides sp.]|jgi:hypothetical protein|uniref:hypothetical protein n=1 Tax=Nocardioides sp. TaxID=35761 RepID=UPI002E312E93|nr:hypothetical protein [Nocardioides sp.]HEX3931272.1 hypothetical protein [Nocardioides sp.]